MDGKPITEDVVYKDEEGAEGGSITKNRWKMGEEIKSWQEALDLLKIRGEGFLQSAIGRLPITREFAFLKNVVYEKLNPDYEHSLNFSTEVARSLGNDVKVFDSTGEKLLSAVPNPSKLRSLNKWAKDKWEADVRRLEYEQKLEDERRKIKQEMKKRKQEQKQQLKQQEFRTKEKLKQVRHQHPSFSLPDFPEIHGPVFWEQGQSPVKWSSRITRLAQSLV